MSVEKLPLDFLDEISGILTEQTEYEQFAASYEEQSAYGLRFNPLLNSREVFLKEMPFQLQPVPWALDGYYCDREAKPGRHAFHEAGAYYIQEPSAMAVADLLDAKAGEKVCDLCAAPGGKTTQIAATMKQKGLLVANEIVPSRAKILSQNIERMGVRNAIVCNEPPERMAMLFPGFFDKILVDAPCSGEGMFRKNPEAVTEWSREQVKACAKRQLFILEQAAQMLKPDGVLVYSTCTFNTDEDEGVIERFLSEHKEFSIFPIEAENGVCSGNIEGTIRLWPHKLVGEGHFAARLRKNKLAEANSSIRVTGEKRKELIRLFEQFKEQYLRVDLEGVFVTFGEELYLVPDEMRELKGIKVIRSGLHLGTYKKNRFEPAHSLAKALTKDEVKQFVTVQNPNSYLRGESFREDMIVPQDSTIDNNGWTLTCIGSYAMGWSKCTNGTYKNHYPKGLRLQY